MMNNNFDNPQTTVFHAERIMEFYTHAQDFNVRRGRIRSVMGDSYIGCDPFAPLPSHPQAQPPIVTKTSYFCNSSNFEIDGGDYVAVGGNFFEFKTACDFPGRTHHAADHGYNSTITRNPYTGGYPLHPQLEPKAPPPINSKNAYFPGASNRGILESDLDTVHRDTVDLSGRHNDGTTFTTGFPAFHDPLEHASQDGAPVNHAGHELIEVQTHTVSEGIPSAEDDASLPGPV